jgi:hypothetical protein
MPATYSPPNIENIISRLAVELQELKNLKIDKPEINEAIYIKEKILMELKSCLEKDNKQD